MAKEKWKMVESNGSPMKVEFCRFFPRNCLCSPKDNVQLIIVQLIVYSSKRRIM